MSDFIKQFEAEQAAINRNPDVAAIFQDHAATGWSGDADALSVGAAVIVYEQLQRNTMVEMVRSFSNHIKNDRTPMSTYQHLIGEIRELHEEIMKQRYDGVNNIGGTTIHDGIAGEAMDVINCALDILFQIDPNFSEEKMIEIQKRKCEKWEKKYGCTTS